MPALWRPNAGPQTACFGFMLFISGALVSCDSGMPTPAANAMEISVSLTEAGNLEDESERYLRLRALYDALPTADTRRDALESLLDVADRWANGRDRYWVPGDQDMAGEGGYLAGYFVLRVAPSAGGRAYPLSPGVESELYPMWCLYRGRMLIWHAIENGFLTDQYFDEGRACLQTAAEAFPDNRILRAYLGTPITWPSLTTSSTDAPEWARLMRETTAKLRSVALFWIRERQAPDGQFGGGWGDDAEMWRNWQNLIIAFDDSEVQDSQTRLADGIFALPRLSEGYSNVLTDVEHSSEDTGDIITSMLHIRPDDPTWRQRALRLADLMEGLWTGTNDAGFLQFRSTYFTASEVDSDPRHACDTAYHQRAMQPALLLWQRSRDPRLTSLFREWMDAYVFAAEGTENEKPAGILPNALSYPSGAPGGSGDAWYNPSCHYTDRTFAYPRALSMLARTLVLTHEITNDDRYLRPLETLAEARRDFLDEPASDLEAGTRLWVGQESRAAVRDGLQKLWLLDETMENEDLILREGSAYARFRITRDRSPVLESLRSLALALSQNEAMYTHEPRFTDRIFRFHSKYAKQFYPDGPSDPSFRILYELATGDLGDPTILPLPAARWHTSPEDFAVFVQEASDSQLLAEIYLFDEASRSVDVSLPRLAADSYEWSLLGNSDETIQSGSFLADEETPRITLQIPANQLVSLRVLPD